MEKPEHHSCFQPLFPAFIFKHKKAGIIVPAYLIIIKIQFTAGIRLYNY